MIIIVSDHMVVSISNGSSMTTQEEMVIIVSDRMVMLVTEGHFITT